MARISSPHVVEVFDAGVHDDRVFIAMALVDGPTLDHWCRRPGRTVDEVLAMFVGAGRGLATAHRAELVHRDFKPSNVLVGPDGLARVTDFGLAVAAVRTTTSRATTRPSRAGTAAYMSPEQHAGKELDERTDQYSFCVALREALTGPAEPTKDWRAPDGRIPGRVHAALRRGLEREPGRRFPHMGPLLEQIDPRRSRRPRAVVVGLGAAILGAGLWALGGDRAPTRCEAGRAAVDAEWNDSRMASLRSDFVATGTEGADAAAERTRQRLDRWLEAWQLGWDQACAAPATDDDRRGRRLDCLDQRRRQLSAFMSRLVTPDADLVARAAAAAASLPPPAECLDAGLEGSIPPLPEHKLAEAVALRDELAQVHADDLAGRVTPGLERAQALVVRAQALAYPPLLAEAQFRLGRLHERAGDYAAARPALEDAYYLATESGQGRLAADAATMMVTVLGIRLQLPDETQPWIGHAMAAAERLADPRRHAAALVARAGVLAQRGELGPARADYQRALALQREAYGRHHPTVAATLNNLGTVAAADGDPSVAREALDEAVTALSLTYGPAHPSVAGALSNLGAVESHLGRTEDAIEHLERARRSTTSSLGPRHPTLAPVLANLGRMRLAQGEAAAARALFEQALQIRRDALGPEHPAVAYAYVHLADAQRASGEPDAAAEHYRRALAILTGSEGGQGWRAGYARGGLGFIALDWGDARAALEHFDAALAAFGNAAPVADREQFEQGRARAQQQLEDPPQPDSPGADTRMRADGSSR